MAIQPNKPQNRIFLIVGVVLAAAAAVAVLFAVSKSGTSSGPTVNVVVAKTTIAAGTSITSDLLTTTALPQSGVPADAFTDPSQVVGKLAPVTLSANIPLTTSLFTSASATGATVQQLEITKGYVAMAIPASGSGGSPGVSAELTSVGFYIQPEDHIDILIDTGTPGAPSVRYAFQDVRVLRAGAAQASSAASGGTTTTASAGAVNSYIIELPRNQAEILTALLTARPNAQGVVTSPIVLKYLLRPQSEWGKRDGTNGFDKPNYESNTGSPVSATADQPVTSAMLTALFPH